MLVAMLLAAGCNGGKSPTFGTSGNSGDGGGTDGGTGDTGDTGGGDGGGTDGGGDTGVATQGFDEPGDVMSFQDKGGQSTVDLTDQSGDSNKDQQFYMVLVNTNDGPLGYQLRYDAASGPAAPGAAPSAAPVVPAAPVTRAPSASRQVLRQDLAAGRVHPVSAPVPPPPYNEADVGVARREFRVRDSMVDDNSYATTEATLWAMGDSVAIWVDNGAPIDWDVDCDGVVDVPAAYDAYGFTNCDLQTIANIFDANIAPNLRALFGSESDVNGDGLVTVLITPQLNVISYTSDDETVQGGLVGSYADPEVDLNDWNAETNPGSDEQEIIYVFAPDPYGFLNPAATATVQEYTSMELAAQIARSFFQLISYNQHVLVGEGAPEEDWLNQGLGALAADLTGFGAVYFADAWDYLDASHLNALVTSSDNGALSTAPVGAQYLFARWLYDAYGPSILTSLVQVSPPQEGDTTPTTGSEHVASVAGASFDELVLKWQVAMLTTGVNDSDGNPLVDPTEYPPYAPAVTLTAPTSSPSPGDYFGANGYQSGFRIRGTNRYMEGGTTASPVENANNRVTASGTDFSTYVTGLAYWGYTDGAYSAQVVRLTDITTDAATVQIQSGSSGFVGAIVRWPDGDPLSPDYSVETIFSPTKVDDILLPALPTDGSPVYGIGEITEPGFTTLVDTGTTTTADVHDTDRWLLDLTDRPLGEQVDVAVHLTRHYADDAGDAAPFNPWVAIVPSRLIPTPTVEGTQRGSCSGGADFQFPSTMLEYLNDQLFMSGDDGSATFEADVATDFTCGEIQASTTCDVDWDRDGILDVDELQPSTFMGQVNAMQCTLNGNDESLFSLITPAEIMDVDTLDDDTDSNYDRARNLGGMADSSGEEAFIEQHLEGGQQYLVIVGAGTYTGAYELEVKQVL